MSTNRPFLANFLAAFRAQSSYKTASSSSSATNTALPQGAQRNFTTRAASSSGSGSGSGSGSSPAAETGMGMGTGTGTGNNTASNYHSTTTTTSSSTTPAHTNTNTNTHVHTHEPPASSPIPITPPTETYDHHRRRGSDSSNGSTGFRDALGPEKWYIGGRSPGGEERFYRLGMVTKGGGRLWGSARVGSFDQLSL